MNADMLIVDNNPNIVKAYIAFPVAFQRWHMINNNDKQVN